MEVLFLGTGTSHGVPSIDCMLQGYERCPKGVCREASVDPRHARTRSSILVQWERSSVLIDVSADFRQQVLREQVRSIDAVLMTHGHADHICGIPDIRSFTRESGPLEFYGSGETIGTIRKSFSYIFDPSTFVGGGIPNIVTHEVNRPFMLGDQKVTPVKVTHGNLSGCFGYRIGNLAYIPDMKSIAADQLQLLDGVEVLILNCLRDRREHSTHLILPQSMELARRIAPRRCLFIHMCHDIHYVHDARELDPWMEFSYDGMRITV